MKFQLIIDSSAEECVTLTVHEKTELAYEIEQLILHYQGEERLIGYKENEVKIFTPNEIECIFVQDSKTYAVTENNEKFIIRMRLYEAEQLLPSNFVKVNKSAIGNIERVEKFTSTVAGSVDVIFKCGHKEYVSRRCFYEIKRRILK